MPLSDEEDLLEVDGLVEGVKNMVVGSRPRLKVKVKLNHSIFKVKQKNQNMRTFLPLRSAGKTNKELIEVFGGRPWLED